MSEPRFYVRELSGLSIPTADNPTNNAPAVTFYIMDRLYNARVVETYDQRANAGGRGRKLVKARAQARCDQLNEWWALELQRG